MSVIELPARAWISRSVAAMSSATRRMSLSTGVWTMSADLGASAIAMPTLVYCLAVAARDIRNGPQGRSRRGPRREPAERQEVRQTVRAILKTNDPILLNFAEALLTDAGIESVVFDSHMSIMDGSMGFMPRRLMVADEDFAQASRVLKEALPDQAQQ